MKALWLKLINVLVLIICFPTTSPLAYALAEVTPIEFKVVYGDRTTLFVLRPNKLGATVDYSNDRGRISSKQVTAKEFQFLKTKVSELGGPTNLRSDCHRSYVELKTNRRTLLGCIGSRNKLTEDLQKLTNLLSIIF